MLDTTESVGFSAVWLPEFRQHGRHIRG